VASAVDAAREAHDAERLQTARRRRNLALAGLLAALGVGALIAARVLVGHVGHP